MTTTILFIHVAATLAMVGLIWFVQIVHYPLFDKVGGTAFPDYHHGHTQRTTWMVAPLMLIELVTAIWLVGAYPDARPLWAWWNLGLLAAIWVSTFLSQVPQHRRLAGGFDDRAYRRLLSGNWFRTLAWTVRGLLVLWAISQTVGS